ncbi:MAG: efflux RND transporter periplasmic adaptor subunit [Marinagarivorans sp.]
MPKFKSRPLVALLALGLLLGLAAFSIWPRRAEPQYTYETLQRGDIENLVTATGSLQPRDYVDVGAQVSGQLKKILVDVGSRVKAGDLLAEIDTTVYAARVEASRAQLRNQQAQLLDRKAQLSLAQIQLKRQQQMYKEEATSLEELQISEANAQSAQAQLKSLEAQIAQTQSSLKVEEANLAYANIYAPMDGTVVSISARQGQTLNTNQMAPTLLRVADLSVMTVKTQVSEADVGKLGIGMPVYFTTLGGQGRRWESQLAKLEPTPETVNNVVLYNALFDVPNPEGALLPQMSTQVFFILEQAKNALLVPVAALVWGEAGARKGNHAGGGASPEARARWRERQAGKTVESVGKAAEPVGSSAEAPAAPGRNAQVKVMQEGRLQLKPVRIGVSNRVHAEVLEGLEEGAQVVSGTQVSAAKAPASSPLGGMGSPGGMGGRRP